MNADISSVISTLQIRLLLQANCKPDMKNCCSFLLHFLSNHECVLYYLWFSFHSRVTSSLRNRACRNASLVNANFSVNQMCPIICRWKLVEHRYCFGDNRRIKDNRKIKLCGLKACCVTLISCSISHNFPALKRWNEKSEA